MLWSSTTAGCPARCAASPPSPGRACPNALCAAAVPGDRNTSDLPGEPPPRPGGETEHRAGAVLGVADGDQVLVLADFDALATVSTGVANGGECVEVGQ